MCSDIPILETIDITFNVDMSEVTVDEVGVSVAGGGVLVPGDNPTDQMVWCVFWNGHCQC